MASGAVDGLAWNLDFAVTLQDAAAIMSVNRSQQGSFWQSSLHILAPCSCRQLRANQVARCTWAAAARLVPASPLQYRVHCNNVARKVYHMWASVDEEDAPATFSVATPEVSRPQERGQCAGTTDAALLVGYTLVDDCETLLECITQSPRFQKPMHWYIRVPLQAGSLPTSFTAVARGAERSAGASVPEGTSIGCTSRICAANSARELRFFWTSGCTHAACCQIIRLIPMSFPWHGEDRT